MLKNDENIIADIGRLLNDEKRPIKERFRALFTLRNIGGVNCVRWIEKCFSDHSVLLKHECAYCLGQMQDPTAEEKLKSILQDESEDPIVRHEAGEALAAIGSLSSVNILSKYAKDPLNVVSETCQLAVENINLMYKPQGNITSLNPYSSVDPAPPLAEVMSVMELAGILLNESETLFKRYRAMFSLRNLGSNEAVLALTEGLKCKNSSLFKHEIAYVLGQMQNPVSEQGLTEALCNTNEHEMVRHECAEALGSIASPTCYETLSKFLKDDRRIVRESCEVALDMCDYENSTEFQYANALVINKDNKIPV